MTTFTDKELIKEIGGERDRQRWTCRGQYWKRWLTESALASLAAVSDEQAAYELFMEKRFRESVDRRRAKMAIENTWHGIWRLAGLSGVTAPPCFRLPTCSGNNLPEFVTNKFPLM